MTEQLQSIAYVFSAAGVWVQERTTVANDAELPAGYENTPPSGVAAVKVWMNCQEMMAKDPRWTWGHPFKSTHPIDDQLNPRVLEHLEDDRIELLRRWVPGFELPPTDPNVKHLRAVLIQKCGVEPNIVADLHWRDIWAILGCGSDGDDAVQWVASKDCRCKDIGVHDHKTLMAFIKKSGVRSRVHPNHPRRRQVCYEDWQKATRRVKDLTTRSPFSLSTEGEDAILAGMEARRKSERLKKQKKGRDPIPDAKPTPKENPPRNRP